MNIVEIYGCREPTTNIGLWHNAFVYIKFYENKKYYKGCIFYENKKYYKGCIFFDNNHTIIYKVINDYEAAYEYYKLINIGWKHMTITDIEKTTLINAKNIIHIKPCDNKTLLYKLFYLFFKYC